MRSAGTGTEARPHVAAIRQVKVAVGVRDETRAGGPTAAAQNLVIAEPRLRIFFVRTGDEAGIRCEVARGPFPYVADHLPAIKRAITGSERSHICCSKVSRLQIRTR